jgi:valyl-tRNA synthetase
MPFITEEIWRRLAPLAGRDGPTVMLEPYPRAAEFPEDAEADREIAWIKSVVLAVRQIRGEMTIPGSRGVPVILQGASALDRQYLERHRAHLERLAGITSLTLLERGAEAPPSATALVGELTVLVPMAGLIDASAEVERLGKLVARSKQDLAKVRGKLANESFATHAPAAIVAAERAREAELARAIAGLEAQLARVRRLLVGGESGAS